MDLSKSIDFLLENAGPVIHYRLRKEILNNLTQQEEENLQEQIYQTPHFQLVQNYVKPDGYIGIGMHSGVMGKETLLQDGEVAARLLSYYAIPKGQPMITNFIVALRDDKILQHEFSYRNAEIARFNNRFFGLRNGVGLMVLVYTMQALLGYGDDEYVKPFQDTSLQAFKTVLPLSSLNEVTEFNPNLKKKYNSPYIREDDYMPCSYHLSTLAYTNSWRTLGNVQLMAEAINKICTIMKNDNSLSVKINGRNYGSLWMLIRPIRHFDVNTVDSIMYRRVLTEIAMLGVGRQVEIIRQSAENVENALAADGILRFNYVSSTQKRKYIPKWPTAYVDVALEPDYKKKTALDCDMTFWAVQFLHYVNNDRQNHQLY